MDTSNGRPTQSASSTVVDPSMVSGDWRAQLPPDARQRIVNKITDTLNRHLPSSSNVGLEELKKIAVSFEEESYTAATSQSDYLRKASFCDNAYVDAMQSSSTANSANSSDPGVL